MQEAKKRGRKDADELQLSQRAKVAAANKGPVDAPALSKSIAPSNKGPGDAPTLSKPIAATAANKGPSEAPALSKPIAAAKKGANDAAVIHKADSAISVPGRHASAAAVVIAAAAAAVAAAGTPASAVQSRRPVASSLFEVLRGELRKRHMVVPSQLTSEMDDGSMASAVHLAETLYVDEILKETSGNVSLAGKIAKIT
jgi:hypothetical protein